MMETMTSSISSASGPVLHQRASVEECERKLIQSSVSGIAQFDKTEKVIRMGLTGPKQDKKREKREN